MLPTFQNTLLQPSSHYYITPHLLFSLSVRNLTRSPLSPAAIRPKPHTSTHFSTKQPQTTSTRESIRQTLEYGLGECPGDVDGICEWNVRHLLPTFGAG